MLRFKFMPTPWKPLHVGHAYLLFVIDSVIRALNQEGVAAELVVVFDELMARSTCNKQPYEVEHFKKIILDDMATLGITPAQAISNWTWEDSEVWQHLENTTGFTPRGFYNAAPLKNVSPADLALSEEVSAATFNSHYFAHNIKFDEQLGITHIIRGADLLKSFAGYATMYDYLGVKPPTMLYLPTIRYRVWDNDGKISSDINLYVENLSVDRILRKLKHRVDDLFGCLALEAVKKERFAPLFIQNRTVELARSIIAGDVSPFMTPKVRAHEEGGYRDWLDKFRARPFFSIDELSRWAQFNEAVRTRGY